MGLNTLIFSTDNFPVPSEWIFEKFLNLPERLTGQSVSIKSIFNQGDKTPSMIIYLHQNGKYKFKDFSSGQSGDSVDLIQHIYKLNSRQDAFHKAYNFWKEGDYETYITADIIKTEYSVKDFKVRNWNTRDAAFWTQFGAGSKELDHYHIRPLESYTFEKIRGTEITTHEFSKAYCYGYFRKDGTLYKIYNPKDHRSKFIKVQNYIQGHDQLEFKAPWLIILSSLKDILAFNSLKFKDIECIAPDSENVMITQKQLNFYLRRYKYISILFDNDGPGKKSAIRYNEEYQLPYTFFNVEKDIADCVREHGPKNSRIFLQPVLKETITLLKQNYAKNVNS